MTRTHYLLLAGFMAAAATVLTGMDHWSEALKPAIVGGLLAQLATVIGAIYSDKPTKE